MTQPSFVTTAGDKFWYQNGQRHRVDGPAVEWSDGICSWYIHGQKYHNLETYCNDAGITGKHKTLFFLKYSRDFKTTKQSS